jgi:hypothetical protein
MRVKIKKRNQADYDITHPSRTPQTSGGDDGVALWATFISSLTTGDGLRSLFNNHAGRDSDYAIVRNRYGATVRAVPPAPRRAVLEDFLSSARLQYAQPPRRAASVQRRTHGSETNPIELSDDENTSARVSSSSSSSGGQPRATGTSSRSSFHRLASELNYFSLIAIIFILNSVMVDLIDLTGDNEHLSSSSSTAVVAAVASTSRFNQHPPRNHISQPYSLAHAHTVPPLHPTTHAMSSFGNYNLMDFLSDDEEDEDYEPPVQLDDELERDDNSELSEDAPMPSEVIELPDSDEEDVHQPGRVNTGSSAAIARLSGIMVWCHECDSYHDKQRVWDDVSYCPNTYASLVSTGGFSDIRQDRSSAGSSSATSSARSNGVARMQVPSHQPQVARANSIRAMEVTADSEDEAEFTSDDSTTSAQWHDRTSESRKQQLTGASAWNLAEGEDKESDLSRTMSDATTASSRSRASQVAASAPEVRTQCEDDDEEEEGMLTRALNATNNSSNAKQSYKRSSWLAYMDEDDSPVKRVRTSSYDGDEWN